MIFRIVIPLTKLVYKLLNINYLLIVKKFNLVYMVFFLNLQCQLYYSFLRFLFLLMRSCSQLYLLCDKFEDKLFFSFPAIRVLFSKGLVRLSIHIVGITCLVRINISFIRNFIGFCPCI